MQAKILCIGLATAFLLSSALFAATDWEAYQKKGHRSPRWDPLVEAGFSAFEGENLNTAVNFLERARAMGCRDGLLLFKLASYQERQGNIPEAIRLLKEAEPLLRNRYPKNQVTRGLAEHLGGLYYQTGQYEPALPEYLTAIRTQGENFLRLYLVGQMYRMKNQPKEAIAYFERALRHDPPAQTPQLKLAVQIELMKLYYDAKNDEKTAQMIERVLAQDPHNPVALSYQNDLTRRKMKAREREIMRKKLGL